MKFIIGILLVIVGTFLPAVIAVLLGPGPFLAGLQLLAFFPSYLGGMLILTHAAWEFLENRRKK